MTDSFIVNCGTHKHPPLKMSLVMNTKRRRSLLLLSRRCGALNTGVMSGMDPLPSLPLCNATSQPTDFKEESLRHRLFTLSRTGTCTRAHARTQAMVRVLQCIPHLVRTFSAGWLKYSPYYGLITTSKHFTWIQVLPKLASAHSAQTRFPYFCLTVRK